MMDDTTFPTPPQGHYVAGSAREASAFARYRPEVRAAELEDAGRLDKTESLPHLSDTIIKAMTIVNDMNSTLADMASLISRDTLLAAIVLKNRQQPGVRRQRADHRRAAGRQPPGPPRVREPDLVHRHDRPVQKHPLPVRVACETILRHSLFCAILASAVNRVLRFSLGGEEFTGALLHDIGRLVICVKAPDHYAAAGLSNYDESDTVLADERQAYGTDHCAVGGLFALKNNLPKPLARVISNHHTPARETEFRDLVGLVAFVDTLANHIQSQHNVQKFDLDKALAFAEIAKKVDRDRGQQLREKLPAIAVESVREARRMMKSIS